MKPTSPADSLPAKWTPERTKRRRSRLVFGVLAVTAVLTVCLLPAETEQTLFWQGAQRLGSAAPEGTAGSAATDLSAAEIACRLWHEEKCRGTGMQYYCLSDAQGPVGCTCIDHQSLMGAGWCDFAYGKPRPPASLRK